MDGEVCDAQLSVDSVPLLADAGKHVLNDHVNDTDLSAEDCASRLVTPKVVVESVSTHYQKFDRIPSVVRRPQQMHSILLSMDQQLELIDFVRGEHPDSTAQTLTSAVQFVEDNFCVKASLSLVRSVLKRNNICLPESADRQSPAPMIDDDEPIQETTKAEHGDVDDFNAAVDVSCDENNPTVPEIIQGNDIQLPVGEDTSSSSVVPLRRSSRRRRTLNREQQHELTRVAKQCNAAAVRKLKSYANTKFNVDVPDQVIGSLLVRHNKGYSDIRMTRFRNSRTMNRGSSPSDDPVTKIIRDERTDSSDTEDDGEDDEDQNCSGQTKDSLLSDLQQDSGSHPARKHLKFSNMVRRTVVQLVCVNKISHAQVGKLLGIPKGTVSTIVRVFKNHDRIDKIKKGGSCPKLTDVQQDIVAKYVEDNQGVTTDRIREYVQETFGVSVTRTTVQKLLKKHNLALRKSHLSFVRYLNNEFYEEPQVETAGVDAKSESICKSLLATEVAAKLGSVGSTDVGGSSDEPQTLVGGRQKKKYASMSNYIRHKIVEFVVRWGMSHAKVGDLLGVPKGTVSGVVRCFQQNNRINKIKHGGAHCKLTKEHQDALVKYVAENDELTIKQAIDYVKQLSGKQVSKNLVYNILRKHNLHKRKKGPVWPEWYLANKEHVVELPATKLLMVNNCTRLSKRNLPVNPSPASPTGKLRIVTDDEASEQEMLTNGMYSQSSGDGPDASTHDHRLTDTSLIGSCGDNDKLPYNYLDDQDSILLQQVQGLFAAVAASSQVDVKSADCASNLDMPSTTANQVEVSTTPPEESGFVGATGGVFADSKVNGKSEAAGDSSAKKQKKRYVPLSNVDRQRVISCVVHKGLSHAVVSKLFDIPRGTVSSIMRCFQKNSRIEKIRKGGSPSKLSGEQQRLMVDYHEQRGKLSIKQLQNYCNETFGVSVSKSTVSLILKKHCSPLKKK